VDLFGDVRVAVEDEGGGVRVGAHLLEDEPVADLSALKLGFRLLADLIKTVAGGSEHGSRDTLGCLFQLVSWVDNRLEGDRDGREVVVNNVVEGAVDAVVDVESLGGTLTALSSVDFGGDSG